LSQNATNVLIAFQWFTAEHGNSVRHDCNKLGPLALPRAASWPNATKKVNHMRSDTNSDANETNYFPEHAIVDLDETYKPRDIVDALTDLRFKHGPKMLRIDAQVRDYLVTAVAALSGRR
jgi:hypothetical protein